MCVCERKRGGGRDGGREGALERERGGGNAREAGGLAGQSVGGERGTVQVVLVPQMPIVRVPFEERTWVQVHMSSLTKMMLRGSSVPQPLRKHITFTLALAPGASGLPHPPSRLSCTDAITCNHGYSIKRFEQKAVTLRICLSCLACERKVRVLDYTAGAPISCRIRRHLLTLMIEGIKNRICMEMLFSNYFSKYGDVHYILSDVTASSWIWFWLANQSNCHRGDQKAVSH